MGGARVDLFGPGVWPGQGQGKGKGKAGARGRGGARVNKPSGEETPKHHPSRHINLVA